MRSFTLILVCTLGALAASTGCWPTGGIGGVFGPWEYACGAAATLGQACWDDGACAEGLYCRGAAVDGDAGTCQRKFAAGRACTMNSQCLAGLVCRGEVGAGTCGAAPGEGEACDGALSNLMCAEGFVCQRITMRCVAPPRAGELCGVSSGLPPCAAGLTCWSDGRSLERDGRCGAALAIGQPCGAGGECVSGAHCDLGRLVCTRNVGAGDSCPTGNECGEAPFDRDNGLECVRGDCIDTSRAGALCWPGEDNRCVPPLTCIKRD